MTDSSIEWLQNPDGSKGKSWNPIRGCSRVSPGCDNCYAMRQAHRFAGEGGPYEGLTTLRKGKVDWSGVARFVPDQLDAPLRWRKPQRVFVNSMSDLFHHSITFEQIAAVFGVMAACPQHTFMVLTKRPERALEFFRRLSFGQRPRERSAAHALELLPRAGEAARNEATLRCVRAIRIAGSVTFDGRERDWPLPNVHLGVSAENQETADERIPLLLKCPAAVRWVSAEPLIGPVVLTDVPLGVELGQRWYVNALTGKRVGAEGYEARPGPRIDWVVVGGESGAGARPMNIEWMRSVVAQCREAGVPVFVKQFGANLCDAENGVGGYQTTPPPEYGPLTKRLKHRKGADLSEVPGEWPREYPLQRE